MIRGTGGERVGVAGGETIGAGGRWSPGVVPGVGSQGGAEVEPGLCLGS